KPHHSNGVVAVQTAARHRVARHRCARPHLVSPTTSERERHPPAEAESSREHAVLVDAQLVFEACEHGVEERKVLAALVAPTFTVGAEIQAFWRNEDRLTIGFALQAIVAPGPHTCDLLSRATPRVPTKHESIRFTRVII